MTDHISSTGTPSELERDAERVRAQIADTAEHLKDKMSPGQLMDEVVGYFKDGDTNQLLSNLKAQVRDNPLALAMVGGGLAWLMMGSGPAAKGQGLRTSQTPVSSTPSLHAGGVHTPGSANPGVSHGTSSGSTMGKGAKAVGDKASSAAASVSHAASTVADGISSTAHDVRDAAGDYMASASNATADAGARLKNTFLDALEREPLVLGALGMAVGAAIGAMLPATRTEQEYLGSAAQKARDTAETALAEGVDKAKHVAGDVYAAAKSEADRQGLMPGDKTVTGKAAEVVKAAGGEAKSASRTALQDADDAASRMTDQVSPKRNPS